MAKAAVAKGANKRGRGRLEGEIGLEGEGDWLQGEVSFRGGGEVGFREGIGFFRGRLALGGAWERLGFRG